MNRNVKHKAYARQLGGVFAELGEERWQGFCPCGFESQAQSNEVEALEKAFEHVLRFPEHQRAGT